MSASLNDEHRDIAAVLTDVYLIEENDALITATQKPDNRSPDLPLTDET